MVKNNNKKTMFSLAIAGAILTAGVLIPDVAHAAPADITALSNTVEGNIEGIKKLAVSIAFMFGLILFIGGLYLIYKDSKQPGQDHAKKGFISIIVGTCLLLLPVMIGVASGSLGGKSDGVDSLKQSSKSVW